MVALHGRRAAAGAAMAALPLSNMAVMAAAEVAVTTIRADCVRSIPMSVIILLKYPRPAPRCVWTPLAPREPTWQVCLCRQQKDAGIALTDDSSGFPVSSDCGTSRLPVQYGAPPGNCRAGTPGRGPNTRALVSFFVPAPAVSLRGFSRRRSH